MLYSINSLVCSSYQIVFEKKTIILEINNTKRLFVKPGFIKTSKQIIHSIFYMNLY